MRKFKVAFTLFFIAVGLFTKGAQANDSAVQGVGGTFHPLRGEHPHIQMVRETVRLDIYRSYYNATARFVFRNDGAATTVPMGFPESAYGDGSQSEHDSGFQRFASAIDGHPVKTRRQVLKSDGDSEEFNALWIKRVPFGARQTRVVEVRYRAPVGMQAGYGITRFASYDFTGGNWHGKVERSDLICTFHEKGSVIAGAYFADNALPMQRAGNTYTYAWRNWEAQGGFEFMWMTALPNWMLISEDTEPLMQWQKTKFFIDAPRSPRASTLPDAAIDYRPPALLQNGSVFIALNDLRDWLKNQSSTAKREDTAEAFWQPDGAAGLHLNKRVLTFPARKSVMLDSARKTSLPSPSPSFMAGGRLYVPLAPVLSVLGGKVTFAPPRAGRSRRLVLTIPPFWKAS